jgi:hypothetical protein
MACRWRLSLSFLAPTFAAEEVRRYAIAGVKFFRAMPLILRIFSRMYLRLEVKALG